MAVFYREIIPPSLPVKSDDLVVKSPKKEQAVKDAGAEFEGGSMQPLVMNLEGARLTKERVYELLKLLQPLD